METNEFVSIDNILFNVLSQVNDEEMKKGFVKGWYVQKIKDALTELAFDTHFDNKYKDVELPSNLAIPMPKDCFNIRKIYLYNGDCCTPSNSMVVHWKRGFNNQKDGSGYTANVMESGGRNPRDPFYNNYPTDILYDGSRETVYFANIQGGKIMFSSGCAGYGKVRIEFDGIGGFSDEMPVIPRLFRAAIESFVVEKFYAAMKGRDPRKWRTSHSDSLSLMNVEWDKAKLRAKRMHSWEKENLREYWGRLNY